MWVAEQWQNTELTQKDIDLMDNEKKLNWHQKHMWINGQWQNTELAQTCSHQTMTKHWCWVTEHWTDTKILRVTGLWQNTELLDMQWQHTEISSNILATKQWQNTVV